MSIAIHVTKCKFAIPNLEDKALPDPPSRMICSISLLGQILCPHQSDCYRVPEHHLNSGGGHRSKIKRTELPFEGQPHVHVAAALQEALLGRGHGDQEGTLGTGAGDEPEELLSIAGLTEEHEDIAVRKDPDVPMEGVDGREEGGASAEGDEGLGDLVGDEAGLSDACEEDGAAEGGEAQECLGEGEGLGEVEVPEEVIEMALLGLEEVQEGGLVDGFGRLEIAGGGGRR